MEKTVLLITDEHLTEIQWEELKYRYDIYRHQVLPTELLRRWTNVNHMGEIDVSEMRALMYYIDEQYHRGLRYVLIKGDPGYTHYIVDYLLEIGMIPLYSSTYTVCSDEEKELPVCRKQHVYFKRYIKYRKEDVGVTAFS